MFGFTSGYQTFLRRDVFPLPQARGAGSRGAARGHELAARLCGPHRACPAAVRLAPSSEFVCPARPSWSACVFQVLSSHAVAGRSFPVYLSFREQE